MGSFGSTLSGLNGATGGGTLSSGMGNGSGAGWSQGITGTLDSEQLAGELGPLQQQQQANTAAAAMPGFAALQNALMNNANQQVNQGGFNQAVGQFNGATGQFNNATNQFNNANNLTTGSIGNQNQALQLAMMAAQGNGPSVSNAQMNAGLANAQANANSMAASNIGAGGLGLRDALMAGAAAQGQAAGQGAVARATEQLGNIQNAGNIANNISNAGIANQNSQLGLANAALGLGSNQLGLVNAQLGQQGNITNALNASTNALNGGASLANNQMNGNLTASQLNTALTSQGSNQIQAYNTNQTQGFSNSLNNVSNIMGLVGKGANTAGSLVGAFA